MLILSRKVDEKIKIGNDISIQIIGIAGDQVKIGVDAPKTVKVFRQEVYDDIQRQNREAALGSTALDALAKLLS
ncbi:MAG: carbon storage regulator CsrA [Treponema sp.]|nr:carbon storage regulator CsrA [Treponema sp.]